MPWSSRKRFQRQSKGTHSWRHDAGPALQHCKKRSEGSKNKTEPSIRYASVNRHLFPKPLKVINRGESRQRRGQSRNTDESIFEWKISNAALNRLHCQVTAESKETLKTTPSPRSSATVAFQQEPKRRISSTDPVQFYNSILLK
jgi:hypothetical protein